MVIDPPLVEKDWAKQFLTKQVLWFVICDNFLLFYLQILQKLNLRALKWSKNIPDAVRISASGLFFCIRSGQAMLGDRGKKTLITDVAGEKLLPTEWSPEQEDVCHIRFRTFSLQNDAISFLTPSTPKVYLYSRL